MQNVQTGYTPEFGLGAVYAGQNAADTQTNNQLDILKSFLANQREQQMQPLDVQIKQWDAASAQDKLNDPEYRDWLRKGYVGQMKSQDAAGNTAQVLAPFKQKAEQSQLENDATKQNLLFTIMDMDKKIRQGGDTDEQGNLVPFTPQDKQQLQALRQQHIEQLGSTPEFWQKQQLQTDRLESNEYIAQLKADAAKKQLQDPKYKEQLAAAMKTLGDPSASPEDKERAADFYQRHAFLVQVANPANFKQSIDLSKYNIPLNPPPIVASGSQPPAQPAAKPAGGGTTIKYDSKGNRLP